MKTLFATFDIFPTTKGASTHIVYSLQALQAMYGSATLVCLGQADMPHVQREQQITIRRCRSLHPNFLKRTELFAEYVSEILQRFGQDIERVHFRDIWSGIPLFEHPICSDLATVFELNGIPSIELPYHYPVIAQNPGLLSRLKDMEQICFERATRIMTVSHVNAHYLSKHGVPDEKIAVIPNTVDVEQFSSPPSNNGDRELSKTNVILYAGTLTPWQGIETLLKAFQLFDPEPDTVLVLACSSRKNLRPTRKMIRKLGLEGRVKLLIEIPRERLFSLYKNAKITVAPLARCDRNELQGCSPFKILESMALGTPVVASSLAVCREIVTHGHDGWLVAPDSPRALANAVSQLITNTDLLTDLGIAAQKTIQKRFNKEQWFQRFRNVYQTLTV